jgi:hypothetical protein
MSNAYLLDVISKYCWEEQLEKSVKKSSVEFVVRDRPNPNSRSDVGKKSFWTIPKSPHHENCRSLLVEC